MAKQLIGNVKGPSAYDIAVAGGFVGTESQWLASLKGDVTPAATLAKTEAEAAATQAKAAKAAAESAAASVPTEADLKAAVAADAATAGTELNDAIASYTTTPADTLPNTAWVGLTEPRAVSIAGKAYVGTTGDSNAIYVEEYSRDAEGPLWLRRHFIAQVPNSVLQDDHNNPAIVVRPGKPMIAIYSGHSIDSALRWRKSQVNIEQGIDFGPERALDLPLNDATAYVNAHVHGNNIWVLHRTGAVADFWSLSKSTDWGETFSYVGRIISAPTQFYASGALVGDVLRVASVGHPSIGTDHRVWYCEINLVTGSITKSDGTVLGNLSGTNLPIAQTGLELIASPLTGQVLSEAVVSNAPNPELVWTAAATGDMGGTGRYWYAVRVAGAWKISPVRYVGPQGNGATWGAGHFPTAPVSQGTVYITRKAGSSWEVVKVRTTDAGTTWVDTVIESAPTTLQQAWPVDQLDSTSLFEVIANNIRSYKTYMDWEGSVRPMPLSLPIKRWEPVGSIASVIPKREVSRAGIYLPGINGNYISTPDTPANSIANGFSLRAMITPDMWASGAQQAILAKWSGGDGTKSFKWGINSDGKPLMSWSADGAATTDLIPSPILPFKLTETAEVRIDFIPQFTATQYRIRFWYRMPGDNAWTYHSGTQVGSSALSVFDSTSPLEIGSRWLGTADKFKGIVHYVEMRTLAGNLITGWRGDVQASKYRDPKGAIWTVNGADAAFTSGPV